MSAFSSSSPEEAEVDVSWSSSSLSSPPLFAAVILGEFVKTMMSTLTLSMCPFNKLSSEISTATAEAPASTIPARICWFCNASGALSGISYFP